MRISDLPREIDKLVTKKLIIDARPFIRGRLLDIGCDAKPHKDILADRVEEYIGLDIRPVSYCGNFRVDVVGDAHELPFPRKNFDTILCTQSLMYFDNPKLAIEEMFRVLKSNGFVVATTALTWRQVHRAEKWRFTEFGLRWLFQEAGFFINTIRPKKGIIGAYEKQLADRDEVSKWVQELDEILILGHMVIARKP